MTYPSGATAMRGRYLVRNPALHLYLRARDAIWALRGRAPTRRSAEAPRRILVSIGGHLGDAVMATGVLPVLRENFPQASISILCAPLQAQVFRGHATVDRIHTMDHWFTGRGSTSWPLRILRSARDAATLAHELRDADYDVAIDLCQFFPNRSEILHRAGIPVRVGYDSGGGGPLLTVGRPWRETRDHAIEHHLHLLREWHPPLRAGAARYDLPPITAADAAAAAALLRDRGVTSPYIVIHPGTGNLLKAWPVEHWEALLRRLAGAPGELKVVLTGAGHADRLIAQRLTRTFPEVTSLCDATSWGVFRGVLAGARAVVGADSVAAHVAAAEGVPSLSLMAAMGDPQHWRPLGPLASILTAEVPCAPCFRSRGCHAMSCIRNIRPDEAFLVVQSALDQSGT